MGLNDDIDDTIVDSDIRQQPIPIDKSQEDITVIVDDKEPTALTESDLQSLVKADVQFKVITDNVDKIVELEDVESELIAAESINKSSAKYIEHVFNGLDNISIEDFTISPSKTNYSKVLNFVRKSIATEELATIELYGSFITQSLKDVEDILERIKDKYLSSFISLVETLSTVSKIIINDVSNSKNKIVSYRKVNDQIEFIDITRKSIDNLNFNNVQLEQPIPPSLQIAVDNIRNILSTDNTRVLIYVAIEKDVITYPFSSIDISNYTDRYVDILTLAKFFNSETFQNYINGFEVTIKEMLIFIKDLKLKGWSSII